MFIPRKKLYVKKHPSENSGKQEGQVANMNKNDYNENVAQGLTVDGSSKMVQITGTHISRRSFAKGVSRMIGLGALSHFSLLSGKALAEEPNYAGDDCPGGDYQEDACSAPGDEDECPGGTWEVDECLTGEAPEDECTASGGCAGGDQELPIPTVDACYPGDSDDTCSLPSPDNAE